MNYKRLACVLIPVVISISAVHGLPPSSFASRGLGAGGGMYYPVISPHSSQTIFVGCDMSHLLYTTNGALSWNTVDFRQLQASTLTEVQFTNNPQILYALDWTNVPFTGNTLERPSISVDGGQHFSPCLNWPSQAVCYAVYAAWNSTTRLFGANASRIYTSSDSGSNFSIAFDASSLGLSGGLRCGGAFFDGSQVWIGTNAGLIYSNTSGDSFQIATVTGFNTTTEAIVALVGAKDPSSGTVRFYCVTANASAATAASIISAFYFQTSQIYRLDGSGANWTATNVFSSSARNGIASGDFPVPIAMARNNIDVVYVAANRPGGTYPDLRTTYKISSAGGAWQRVLFIPNNQNISTGWGGSPSNGRLDYAYPLGIGVDPNDANHVIACDDALIEMTANGGTSWGQIYVNPADQNAPGAAISASTTYRSVGLEVTAAHWMDWSSANIVHVGSSDMAMTRSTDGGTRWGFPGGFSYDEIYQIIHHPSTGVLYAVSNHLPSPYFAFSLNDATYDAAQGAIYFSINNGASWSLLKPYSAFNGAPVWMTLDAANDRLYASTANSSTGGIYRIDHLSNGAGADAPVKLTAPPRTQGHAYVLRILSQGELVCTYSGRYLGSTPPNQGFSASSGVFYSTDGGQAWADRTDTGMKYWTQEVAIDPLDENTWYAGVWNTMAFTPGSPNPNTLGGLYKSVDRGLNWTRIYNGDSVQSVCFNPSANHSNEMYVCTRLAGLLYTGNLRDPNGATFTQVAAFPFRQPTHVFFNPYNSSELWVTSYGNGIRVGTIPAGTLQFNSPTFNTTEGQTAAINVSRLNGDNGAVSVNFATGDGTATAGSDYTALSGTLNWSDGDTAVKTFSVVTKTDQLVEGTETVLLSLNSPGSGATLGSPSSATLNIADSAMDVWRGTSFGAQANTPTIGGDLASPSADGVTNLVKYALGLNPFVPVAQASFMTTTIEGGYLTLTINRAALPADVTISAQVTGNLTSTWQPDVTILTNTATLFKARDNVLASSTVSRFIRAVFTRP